MYCCLVVCGHVDASEHDISLQVHAVVLEFVRAFKVVRYLVFALDAVNIDSIYMLPREPP